MTINQALGAILHETVEAFSNLDSARLHSLEQRIVVIAASNVKFESSEAAALTLQKQRQLEIVLQNSQANLDALTRLHARNTRNQWAL
jgi:hypothetical protein